MKRKHLYTALCSLLLFVAQPLWAQTPVSIEDDMRENVTIHQDSAITRLIQDKILGASREQVQVSGYRVQIYSSNRQQTAKAEAFDLEKRLQQAELQVPIYVLYNPPFWKVRLGDFRTQEEAKLMKEEVIRRMPELQGDTYVVRDQITVVK